MHRPDNPQQSAPSNNSPKVITITCAVLEQELVQLAERSEADVAIEVLEQGLHNEPDRLRAELQAAIDRAEQAHPDARTVTLGYGLCSRGTEGVRTGRCRLVVPRAHDCITLLLGSRQRYQAYVDQHPGTYWYSPGWNRCHIPPGRERYEKRRAEYVEQYGPDNADYLMQTMEQWYEQYNRATYVDLGIGVTDQDLQYTRDCARWLGWSFDHQHGDPALLQQLLTGPWPDEHFLTLKPGQTYMLTADQRVIAPLESAEDSEG
jgi:hypothetical protein